jgi:aerobic carbon-monoxide dehydrogenase large subunit
MSASAAPACPRNEDGTAIWHAADEIIGKGTRIAAEALEAAEADIRFADGGFVVAGTDRSLALLDVAALARDKGSPLDAYHAWTREWMTFPNGAHVVEVEIDPRHRPGDARSPHSGR